VILSRLRKAEVVEFTLIKTGEVGVLTDGAALGEVVQDIRYILLLVVAAGAGAGKLPGAVVNSPRLISRVGTDSWIDSSDTSMNRTD
jgi:hypothetical protein